MPLPPWWPKDLPSPDEEGEVDVSPVDIPPAPSAVPASLGKAPVSLNDYEPMFRSMAASKPSVYQQADEEGARNAFFNHLGAGLDASARYIAGVGGPGQVQERPELREQPLKQLQLQASTEHMLNTAKGKVPGAASGKSTDATSPASRAAQKALLATFKDLTPEDVAAVPEAFAERFSINHNAALERAGRQSALTAQEAREQARIEQQAKEGTLNRAVQWARLRQDAEQAGASLEFRKWLFEQEEAAKDKERAAKEQEKTEAVQVPGFDVAPGVKPTADDAKDLKKMNAAAERMRLGIANLRQLHAQYGNTPVGVGADLQTQALRSVQLEAKNIAELGALSGPDYALMQAISAADPGSLGTLVRRTFGGASLEESLQGLEKWMSNNIQGTAKARGYRPKAVGAPGPQRAPASRVLPTGSDGKPTLDTSPPAPKTTKKYSPSKDTTYLFDGAGNLVGTEKGDTRGR